MCIIRREAQFVYSAIQLPILFALPLFYSYMMSALLLILFPAGTVV
jgi:hypothetical protein